jgi:two-component system cell cycle sensor histidine kinase/response regulator CckA
MTALSQRRVLLVDDDAQQRKLLAIHLTQRGFAVETAADGVEAIEMARRQPPDAILSDVRMPRLDGFDLCIAIRSDPQLSAIPVVLCSTQRVGEHDRLLAIDVGANSLMARTADEFTQLIDKIEESVRLGAPAARAVPSHELTSARRTAVRLDRRLAELEAVGEKHRALMDYALDGIAMSDANGLLLDVNRAWLQMLGRSREELVGKSWVELLPVETRHETFADFQKRFAAGESMATKLIRQARADGSLLELDLTVSFATVAGQHVAIAIARDVTERSRNEQQMRQSQKLEAVGQLAGGVAHDFNNVLAVILANCHFLIEDMHLEDPRREDAADICSAAERAVSLTRQLTAFCRKQVMDPKVVSLNSAVGDVWKWIRRAVGEDIHVQSVFDPAAGNAFIDVTQLEQVVLNLVLNARDAMPKGGKLTVETRNVDLDEGYVAAHLGAKAGRYVMLAVSDDGTGMDERTKARVFEPFFTTKEKGKGTGLGLSTVFGIVKQSGGYIMVYSEPGRGTTFKIYLPRVDAPALPALPVAPIAERGAGETVLVLEDDDLVRNAVRRVLKASGYKVLVAHSADEALAICRSHPATIDLLLTDCVLPGTSGPDAVRRLVPLRPSMKVIFMSGFTDHAIVQQGILEPGVHFIQKPFAPAGLAGKIRAVLAA